MLEVAYFLVSRREEPTWLFETGEWSLSEARQMAVNVLRAFMSTSDGVKKNIKKQLSKDSMGVGGTLKKQSLEERSKWIKAFPRKRHESLCDLVLYLNRTPRVSVFVS